MFWIRSFGSLVCVPLFVPSLSFLCQAVYRDNLGLYQTGRIISDVLTFGSVCLCLIPLVSGGFVLSRLTEHEVLCLTTSLSVPGVLSPGGGRGGGGGHCRVRVSSSAIDLEVPPPLLEKNSMKQQLNRPLF